MLVFEGNAGDFRQLEGIIAALRALHLSRAEILHSLLRIYAAMKGEGYQGEIDERWLDSPLELARNFIFDLPPMDPIPVEQEQELNERLVQFLIAA